MTKQQINWRRSQMTRLLEELSDAQIEKLYLAFINDIRVIAKKWQPWFLDAAQPLKRNADSKTTL
ncbi:MAG: hypothetical protein K0R66_1350 [Gammaproteobacteria bacterium]|jgi:hypothetical protein|nr:hypothetical protein [Gammaproteobacteria bacterium]